MEQIKLGVGEQYILKLMPKASAGYMWDYVLEGDSGVVDIAVTMLRPSSGIDSHGPLPGTSFEEQFTIKGKKPGRANIRFLLHRPFERDKLPLDERLLEVTVY